MTPRNAAAALAGTVVDELLRGGVGHVVLCPGSRSAPLAFAVHAAATAGRVSLHTRIDERTAGFLALGIATTARRPVVVVTTSGTAVANLHPAVLEASHRGVPLVLLTADRPAALRGTGANQTTDQVKIFGGAVRLLADVAAAHPGWPAGEWAQVRGWRALVARAVLTATGRGATARGPVHLNVQVEGATTPDVADGWSSPLPGRPGQAPWTVSGDPGGSGGSGGSTAAARLEAGPRTVVLAGDGAGPPARILAERAGWPLLAEPTSGARTGDQAIRTYRLLLGDEDLAGRVERVVVHGHPTLSRPVTRLLGRSDVEVVGVVADATRAWTDPGHAVSRVVAAADPPLRPGPGEERWLAQWKQRDAALGRSLDLLLAAQGTLTPQQVAGAVARALPAGGLFVVGASNPIRDLDLMVPRYPVGEHRLVVANRGLAGIDGTVSTAVGAALGRPRTTRALALLGDVTFLHDATGLVLGPDEPRPDLTVVVVNDDGGSIFAVLEQGAPEHAAAFERVFATPHGVDLAALCAATGTPHRRVRGLPALEEALLGRPQGIEVVEAVVARDHRRELDAAIGRLVASSA